MSIEPELLKQLLHTFKSELEEKAEIISNGLLRLENENLQQSVYDVVLADLFRAAHNVKGSARGLGITDVSDIAHQLESIFVSIKNQSIAISPELINICLESTDKMVIAFQCYINKQAVTFDMHDLLSRLAKQENSKQNIPTKKKVKVQTEQDITYKSSEKAEESIRVPIDNIDHISTLVEGLQVNKIAIEDHYSELIKLTNITKQFASVWKKLSHSIKNGTANEDDSIQKLLYTSSDYFNEMNIKINQLNKTMRSRTNDLNIVTTSLQNEIRRIRLIPAAILFNPMRRYVRDLAQELNKQVELIITGDDIKMDKIILEKLKDPINHLLRNCIDHGIEAQNIRIANNKSESGIIDIRIIKKEGQVYITITDDGAGIDIQKIADTAVKKNIITSEELKSMPRDDILSLIFRHGFSTKDIITDISGRGVGLDVVKINVEAIGGTLNVYTELGKFTTFELRVPMTLSSARGFIVSCDQQLFVIPTSAVYRVLQIDTNQIINVEGGPAIIVDSQTIALCTLNSILGYQQHGVSDRMKLPIIVLNKGSKFIAILVDDILGEREIVIKPMQPPITNVPCVSGGTLVGNNQVITVLESNELINKALNLNYHFNVSPKEEKKAIASKPSILIVDDSITTRTLEKNILESKNYQVTVAVNGKDAWDILQKSEFSLVITDVSMPIMDGFTLTEHIKKSDKLRDMPVIIVTSLGSDEEKKRGVAVGANAYIVKHEFESSALLDIVEQLI